MKNIFSIPLDQKNKNINLTKMITEILLRNISESLFFGIY